MIIIIFRYKNLNDKYYDNINIIIELERNRNRSERLVGIYMRARIEIKIADLCVYVLIGLLDFYHDGMNKIKHILP